MKTRIQDAVGPLLDEFYNSADSGRKNELKIEVRDSMHKLANRYDRGFNIEVRMGPAAADENDEHDDADADERAKHFAQIKDASPELRFIRTDSTPILSLPESTKDEPTRTTTTAKKSSTRKRNS